MSRPEFELDVIMACNLMGTDFNLKISAPAKKRSVQCYQKDTLAMSWEIKYFGEINQTQNFIDFQHCEYNYF